MATSSPSFGPFPSLESIALAYAGSAVNADLLALIAGACRDYEKLRFRYCAWLECEGIESERSDYEIR